MHHPSVPTDSKPPTPDLPPLLFSPAVGSSNWTRVCFCPRLASAISLGLFAGTVQSLSAYWVPSGGWCLVKTKSDSVRRDFSSKDRGCRVGRSCGRKGGVRYHRPVAFSTRSASPSRGRQNEFSFMERSKQCWKEPGVGRWEERVARRNRGSENVPEASLSSRGAACRLRQGRAQVPGLEEEER